MTIQDQITSFWNAVGPHYEGHAGNTTRFGSPEYQRWVELFRRALPGSPCRLLDVCTGTGFAAMIAARLRHDVTAIDLAPEILAATGRIAEEHDLVVRVLEGDALEPDFPPHSFDVITCRHGAWTLREPGTAVRNWHDLLRPGGSVVVIDGFHSGSDADPDCDGDRFFRSHYTAEVQASTGFMHVKEEGPLREAFYTAGFSPVSIERLPRHFADDDTEPYLLIATRRA